MNDNIYNTQFLIKCNVYQRWTALLQMKQPARSHYMPKNGAEAPGAPRNTDKCSAAPALAKWNGFHQPLH